MTWKASRILKMWLDVHGKLIKLVYQKKVYEEAKLTTCTKDDCKGAQVYGRQSRHICEPYLVNPLCFRKKKKKKETIRTYFSHSKGSKTYFTTSSHSSYLPAFTLLPGEGKTETYDWLLKNGSTYVQFCLNVWSHFTSHASTIFTA